MRRRIAGLFASLVGIGAAHAQQPPAAAVDPAYDVYAQPQRLVTLPGGRRIHLYCQGRGAPTVILTAGLGGASMSWIKVQSAVAARTRVCAWDRAGFGHSDPSPEPQTVASTTADLERGLAGGGIKGPYVLVGHSAGAYETLMFTDRHRKDVAGVVLVDGSVPDQVAKFAAISPDLAAGNAASQTAVVGFQRQCATNLEKGILKPDTPAWNICFQYPREFSPKVLAAMAGMNNPERLRTRASLS